MVEAIPAGTTLQERYIITQCIGAGAHARVYAGVDTQTSRAVALKVTHRRDPELLARFRREALICARLGAETAGIVRCHAYHDLPEGGAFLVLDLIEGAERLDLDSGSREERLDLIESLAGSVAWLHERGVIHRDLKPANVLRDGRGRLYLSDFGLAKELGAPEHASDAGLTHRNASLGTPAYMPLEQFENARDVDRRADVFALGAMLFRTLTGITPYRGDAVEVLSDQMRVRHTDAAPPRPSSFDASVPPALNALCLAATELDPAQRLPDAGAFLEALRKARRGEAPGGPAPSRRLSSGRITLDKLQLVIGGQPRELAILREFSESDAGLRRFDVVYAKRSARVVLLSPSATRDDDRRLAHEAQLYEQLSGDFTWRPLAKVESGLLLERPLDLPTFEFPWPPALVIDLGLDLLAALVELHELGFVHCGIAQAACGLRGASWSSLRELREAVSKGASRLVLGSFSQARSKAFLRRLDEGHPDGGGLPPPLPSEEGAPPETVLRPASDLWAVGRLLGRALGPRAETIPAPLGGRLRELLEELSHPDPEHRPGAEEARAILADLGRAEEVEGDLLRQRAL